MKKLKMNKSIPKAVLALRTFSLEEVVVFEKKVLGGKGMRSMKTS